MKSDGMSDKLADREYELGMASDHYEAAEKSVLNAYRNLVLGKSVEATQFLKRARIHLSERSKLLKKHGIKE